VTITSGLEIRCGLLARYRRQVAELYYQAFRQKLRLLLGSPQQGLAILERDLHPEHAIGALQGDLVLGVAGLHYAGHHFFHPQVSTFVGEFGWLGGLCRLVPLRLFLVPRRQGVLYVDALAVRPGLRGQGIGTHLLQAVFAFAREKGFASVWLEVVNTNPDARRLYERMGFVPVKRRWYPLARYAAGFSTITTMVKEMR